MAIIIKKIKTETPGRLEIGDEIIASKEEKSLTGKIVEFDFDGTVRIGFSRGGMMEIGGFAVEEMLKKQASRSDAMRRAWAHRRELYGETGMHSTHTFMERFLAGE